MLDDSFRLAKALPRRPRKPKTPGIHDGKRRVRTPEGMKVFDQPIGTVITPDMIRAAKAKGKLPEANKTGGMKQAGGQLAAATAADKKYASKLSRVKTREQMQAVIDDFNNDASLHPTHRDKIKRDIQDKIDEMKGRGVDFQPAEQKIVRPGDKAVQTPVKPAQKPEQPKAVPKPGAEAKAPQKPETQARDYSSEIGNAKDSAAMRKLYDDIMADDSLTTEEKIGHLRKLNVQAKMRMDQIEQPRGITEAQKAVVAEWQATLVAHTDWYQLENSLQKLEQDLQDHEITKEQYDSLKPLLDAKYEEAMARQDTIRDKIDKFYEDIPFPEIDDIDPALMDHALLPPMRSPKDRWAAWEQDPTQAPAWEELAAGKDIEKVKKLEGLWVAMQHMPDRFEVTPITSGSSQSFVAVDKKKNKKYFVKAPEDGGMAQMYGEDINEVFSSELGAAAFPDLVMKASFLESPNKEEAVPIMMDDIGEWAKKTHKVDIDGVEDSSDLRWSQFNKQGGRFTDEQQVADPKNPLAMAIFDFLTNQTDRHSGNVGVITTKKGTVLVPLDNGGAFLANSQYKKGIAEVSGDVFDDSIVDNPAETTWKGFNDTIDAIRTTMATEVSQAFTYHKVSKKKAAQLAEEVLAQFRQVDFEDIIERMLERYDDMDLYHQTHLMASARIWRDRLARLKAEDVVERYF